MAMAMPIAMAVAMAIVPVKQELPTAVRMQTLLEDATRIPPRFYLSIACLLSSFIIAYKTCAE
jgi:hypothetical protein